MIEKKGYLFIGIIIATLIFVFFTIYFIEHSDPFNLLLRLCGLYGFFGLSISTIMTPFLKEIRQTFGRNFIEVHHVTAVVGIACITIHPTIYAIQTMSLAIFLPNFGSWLYFWTWAGPPALMIIYIALVAVLIRLKILTYWRFFHALMYVAILFGIIHADLIQSDFAQSPILLAIYNALFAVVAVIFFYNVQKHYKRTFARAKPGD